jgi:hypothetical protein
VDFAGRAIAIGRCPVPLQAMQFFSGGFARGFFILTFRTGRGRVSVGAGRRISLCGGFILFIGAARYNF